MIFIVRKRALGDVIWIEPFVRYLIEKNKGRQFFIYTKSPQVFENYPYKKLKVEENPKWYIKIIIRVLTKLKFSNCYVLDDVYEDDPQKHFLKAYYDKFNIKEGYFQYPSLDHLLNKDFGNKRKIITFHIANNQVLQLYRKMHGIIWEEIFSYIIDMGFEVQVISKEEESQLEPGLPIKYFSGSFRDLVNSINTSAYFIGLDSAPSHIAASLKIPSIIFFGSVNPLYRHFISQFKGFFLKGYCEKAGCYHVQPKNEQVCLLNDDHRVIPKCTMHSNTELISAIQKLINKYEV